MYQQQKRKKEEKYTFIRIQHRYNMRIIGEGWKRGSNLCLQSRVVSSDTGILSAFRNMSSTRALTTSPTFLPNVKS